MPDQLLQWLHAQIRNEKKTAAEFLEEASRSTSDHREHCLFGSDRSVIREEVFHDVIYANLNPETEAN